MSSDEEERFEGVALLHDVVRIEDEALRLLRSPTAETRLRFAIEKCGTLIDARDPVGAAAAWDRIVAISVELDPLTAGSMRARIDEKYDRCQAEVSRLVAKRPGTLDIMLGITRGDALPNAKVGAAAKSLVKAMPGVERAWLSVAEHCDDVDIVAKAFNRARRLGGMATASPAPTSFPLTGEEGAIVRGILSVWLTRHGVSEVAKKLGVKPTVISQLRFGERPPTRALLGRIAHAYGITLEKMLELALVPQELAVQENQAQSKRSSAA